MSGPADGEPRGLAERREAALEHLASSHQLWLATASDGHGPHLIPVSYVWDGTSLTTATFARSRTSANIRSCGLVRAAIGSTGDLLMIDAVASVRAVTEIDAAVADAYARVASDPRSVPGFTYIQLLPQRMQVWRGAHEFTGRTVMLEGDWLAQTVD